MLTHTNIINDHKQSWLVYFIRIIDIWTKKIRELFGQHPKRLTTIQFTVEYKIAMPQARTQVSKRFRSFF